MRTFSIFIWCFMSLYLIACGQVNTLPKTSLIHYAPQNATTIELSKNLSEISGITFGKDDKLYAEQDEKGNVYIIDLQTGKAELFSSLNENGDFEDICYANERFYLLRSDGMIVSFPDNPSFSTKDIVRSSGILPAAEYEGFCFCATDSNFYALAKKTAYDNKEIWIYQLVYGATGLTTKRKIQIDIKELDQTTGWKIGHFRPSAIAFNTIDNQWYILSSVNQLLIILDQSWKIVDYAILNRQQYPQPEGMTFDKKGNLWLSSEAGNTKKGRIYKMERN